MAHNNHYKKQEEASAKKPAGLKIAVGVGAMVLLAALLLAVIWPEGDLYADIVIENYGTVTVKLDKDAAPITVDNFVKLAKSGFYDGLTFHRIMEGFMMQGGDPTGTGGGSSGSPIKGEFAVNGWDNPISHKRGVISMARRNAYDSASCQFFIVHEDSTSLDGKYAAFGYVTEGMDIVDEICKKAGPVDRVLPKDEQPVIKTVRIHR